jgi:hypothetical protein
MDIAVRHIEDALRSLQKDRSGRAYAPAFQLAWPLRLRSLVSNRHVYKRLCQQTDRRCG